MPPLPSRTSRPAPLDTLRLSREDKQKLVAWVESQGREVADNRRRLRVGFHGRKVFGRLFADRTAGPLCSLVPRNLSTRGFSFVHGVFVNTGIRCRITLPMLGNRWCEVEGVVHRCRHVQGIVHEVSVVFDEELDLAELVSLTPEQGRRLEREALGGAADAPGESDAEAPGGSGASGGCVLLVDPDAQRREALVGGLAAAGFTPVACGSNHAAREAVAAGLPGGGPPAAVLLLGGVGSERAGVAELRYDPVALAGHLRRGGVLAPILLRPPPAAGAPGSAAEAGGADAAALQRRAAFAGVTEVLSAGLDAAALCAAVRAHTGQAAAGRAAGPLRSLRAGRPEAAGEVEAFTRRVGGHRERLRRPGAADEPAALRAACERLLLEASASGFPAVTESVRAVLAAVAAGDPAATRGAVAALDAMLGRVEGARAAA